jgi:hypothetical protein
MPRTGGRHVDISRGVHSGLQMISFAIEWDEDERFKKWIVIKVPKNRSIANIAAARGNPEDALEIAKKNNVKGINKTLWKPLTQRQVKYYKAHPKKKKPKQVKTLQVPGNWRKGTDFHVLAGDSPPRVVGGYAKFNVIDRPERAGLLQFDGYDPIELEIPVRFEAVGSENAKKLEEDIALLEKMAGRGRFEGAAVGPPPVVGISVTGGKNDKIVNLLSRNYQRQQGEDAPLWRIANIDWGDDARRTRGAGNRTRQTATITARQHIDLDLATRSATKRARRKKSSGKKGSSTSKKSGNR